MDFHRAAARVLSEAAAARFLVETQTTREYPVLLGKLECVAYSVLFTCEDYVECCVG